jgi:pantoate--beta-alanine ligase
MSSRNVRLSEEERRLAPQIHDNLQLVSQYWNKEQWQLGLNLAQLNLKKEPFCFEYLCACDPFSLAELNVFQSNAIVLVAVQLGSTRLIDNIIIVP